MWECVDCAAPTGKSWLVCGARPAWIRHVAELVVVMGRGSSDAMSVRLNHLAFRGRRNGCAIYGMGTIGRARTRLSETWTMIAGHRWLCASSILRTQTVGGLLLSRSVVFEACGSESILYRRSRDSRAQIPRLRESGMKNASERLGQPLHSTHRHIEPGMP